MKKKIRYLLLNLVLLGASLGVSALIGEGMLRLFLGGQSSVDPVLKTDRLLYHPNQVAHHRHLEWDVEYRINEDGFRDSRNSLSRAYPGGLNVVLGDSFAMGWCVDEAKSFAAILDREAGPFVNAGHAGGNPKTYIATFDEVFEKRKDARSVLMVLYLGNDLVNQDTLAYFPVPRRGSLLYRIRVFLALNSQLYRTLNLALKSNPQVVDLLIRMGVIDDFFSATNIFDPGSLGSLDYTLDLIDGFRKRLKANGVGFRLVVIPVKEQIYDHYWERAVERKNMPANPRRYVMNERIAGFARERGMRVLDLTDGLLKASRTSEADLYFQWDDHWTPQGHEEAARLILDWIQNRS